MAEAKCNISFAVDYTSSLPITDAAAVYKYRIKGSTDPYTEYSVNPAPVSGGWSVLHGIQSSGEYELVVKLTVNGVTAEKTGSFIVDKCNLPYCKVPSIERVYLGENDQIIMDYFVDETDLDTPEYQIATDADFKKIIHLRVGIDYHPTEYIEMNDGNIPDGTTLYMRARKHCAPSGVSEWSNVIEFRSGKWVASSAYTFGDAYCVSGEFENPMDSEAMGASICWTDRNPLIKTIRLSTSVPQKGSIIYLSNGITRAIPGNLKSFDDEGGPNKGFDLKGIRWIRFGSYNPSAIYSVDPKTGEIGDVSLYCTS